MFAFDYLGSSLSFAELEGCSTDSVCISKRFHSPHHAVYSGQVCLCGNLNNMSIPFIFDLVGHSGIIYEMLQWSSLQPIHPFATLLNLPALNKYPPKLRSIKLKLSNYRHRLICAKLLSTQLHLALLSCPQLICCLVFPCFPLLSVGLVSSWTLPRLAQFIRVAQIFPAVFCSIRLAFLRSVSLTITYGCLASLSLSWFGLRQQVTKTKLANAKQSLITTKVSQPIRRKARRDKADVSSAKQS